MNLRPTTSLMHDIQKLKYIAHKLWYPLRTVAFPQNKSQCIGNKSFDADSIIRMFSSSVKTVS